MTKPHLLLLHGALGASSQFDPLIPHLEPHFELHLLDFEGHGQVAPHHEHFRIEHFANNVLAFLDRQGLPNVHIFGYSMGGYVGLFLARHHPERVGHLFTLATKFAWTPEAAAREIKFLDAAQIKQKVPQFAQALHERHPAFGWEQVLAATSEMITHLGQQPAVTAEDAKTLSHRIRIGVGDRDNMVGLEESMQLYGLLPKGEFQVFPATPHPFERISPQRLAQAINDFFGG